MTVLKVKGKHLGLALDKSGKALRCLDIKEMGRAHSVKEEKAFEKRMSTVSCGYGLPVETINIHIFGI